MKKRLLLIIFVSILVLSGCDVEEIPETIEEVPEIVEKVPEDSPSIETKRINELYWQFNNFEKGDVDIWVERDEGLGSDHYQRAVEQLNSFESQGIAPEDIERVREKLEPLDPGRGYIISQLPNCTNQMFTVSPVDLNVIEHIPPLGGINHAGHILPSDHLGPRIREDFPGNTLPIIAPGEIYIHSISTGNPNFEPEYELMFALCKDVFGYLSHLKTLSSEMKLLFDDVPCKGSAGPSGSCHKQLSLIHKVDAGTLLGEIGRDFGISDLGIFFDFGTHDYRKPLPYVNPGRYSYPNDRDLQRGSALYIVCPLDLYEGEMKSQLYDKLRRTVNPRCGEMMQDVPGTLQGAWFSAADATYGYKDEAQLGFLHAAIDPSEALISIGGTFTEVGLWRFAAKSSGLINREFSQVTLDGNIYCYDQDQPGRILVELLSETKLQIEHQSGSCSGTFAFRDPTTYNR